MVRFISHTLHTAACLYCIVFRADDRFSFYSAGTASVIIALTDGELNEWQFDTAQREVRHEEEHKRQKLKSAMMLHFSNLQNKILLIYLISIW